MAEGVNTKMKVEIWSDVMCPFCLIGKNLYEAALVEFPYKDYVETEWLSYQIAPDISENVTEKQNAYAFLANHKGVTYDEAVKMHEHVADIGKKNGVHFHFDKTIVANTFNAHRIIQMAKEKGLTDKAENSFFEAFFYNGDDLGNINTLIQIGAEIGLSKSEVELALSDEAYAYLVKQDIQEAHNIGLTGVPFFVFNRRYDISGAEPLKVFTDTLHQAFEEWKKIIHQYP